MSSTLHTYERQANAGKIVVGVADLALTRDPDATIITHALGSCIGVTVYDPVACVGGMLHFMLPTAKSEAQRTPEKALMFGDMGIPLLFRAAYDMGAKKERLIVCAAGGAEILSDDGHFKVGSRNRTILRKLFWKNNVLLSAEDTGGTKSRTMSLHMNDGSVEIRHRGQASLLWPNEE